MTKEDRTAVAFLFGVAALYFVPVLLKGDREVLSSVGTDIWAAYYYWRHFGFESLARGEIPLWNPHSFSGIPFVAGMESAIFYPPNLIYLLFGTAFATNFSIALHCFLASLFTYIFARYVNIDRAGAVLAAITFAYGAPSFLRIYAGHLVGLAALVWLPLLFMSAEAFLRKRRLRYALLGGVVLSMQFFAGQPQYLFFSMIAVSLYFFSNLLAMRNFRAAPYFFAGFCLLAITGVSLSAVQFLPTLELTKYSVRSALGFKWVSSFSLPPENLLTLMLPDLFGDLLTAPYWGKNYLWEMSVYLGIIPLALGALAIVYDRSRAVLIFSLIAVASLVLALGKYTPLLRLLYAWVPGFNLFRGFSKFIVVFSFAVSILAGYGATHISAWAKERDSRLRSLAYVILAFAILLLLVALSAFLGTADLQPSWTSLVKAYDRGLDDYSGGALPDNVFLLSLRVALRDLLRSGVVLFLLGGLLLSVVKLKAPSRKLLMIGILALAVSDLWSFGSRYLVSFNPGILYMDRELKAFLKSDKDPFRLGTPISTLLNTGLLEDLKDVGGYDQLTLKNYNEFINFSQGLPLDQPNFVMAINRFSPLLRLLNLKYYIVESSVNLTLPDFKQVFENANYKVYRDEKSLPRSFVVHDVRVIKGREARLQALASSTFNPETTAIVEEPIEGPAAAPPTLRSPAPTLVKDSPNRVVIEADLKDAGLLVLSDVYYPGWKAFVDGKETRIYQVNHAMRGVVLPKGRHVTEFLYDPLSFKIGAVVSLASLVLVVGFLVVGRFKFNGARFRRG
jgi:uncharacterized membrane protein YfhO